MLLIVGVVNKDLILKAKDLTLKVKAKDLTLNSEFKDFRNVIVT